MEIESGDVEARMENGEGSLGSLESGKWRRLRCKWRVEKRV
ncbi:hypothetical protein [Clostridium sp.]|jgi:hypothetical protein